MNIPEANGAKLVAVPNFPGYVISDQGELFCNLSFHPKIRQFSEKYRKIKGGLSRGRRLVTLSKEGEVYYKYIHRLVLESFIGPCPEGMECCHNDGNPLNNNLDNLRWDTRKSNSADTIKHGNDSKRKKKFLSDEIIINILKLLDNGESQDKIAKQFNISQTFVNNLNRGISNRNLQIKLGRKVPVIRTRAGVKVNYRKKLIEKFQTEIYETQERQCHHNWVILESLAGLEDKQCSVCGKYDLSLGI